MDGLRFPGPPETAEMFLDQVESMLRWLTLNAMWGEHIVRPIREAVQQIDEAPTESERRAAILWATHLMHVNNSILSYDNWFSWGGEVISFFEDYVQRVQQEGLAAVFPEAERLRGARLRVAGDSGPVDATVESVQLFLYSCGAAAEKRAPVTFLELDEEDPSALRVFADERDQLATLYIVDGEFALM